MMNRIASFHNYQTVQNDLQRQENKIHHNHAQLASGKKLMTAADDPLAAHYVQGIKQQTEELRQYMDSIVLIRNRLEHQEVMIASAEQYADEAKRSVMEMINGALSPEDRAAKSRELEEMVVNMLNLVNSQDESGNYIFAGTKPKSQPFFRDYAGDVSYLGDTYHRNMKIANGLEIPVSDPGNKVFMEIDNPLGDYDPQYELQVASELLVEKATNLNYDDQSEYRATFVDMGDGSFGYQLEKDGSVVKSDNYDPKEGIKFEDLHLQFKGRITPGDAITFEPKKSYSIFETFQKAMKYSERSVADSNGTAELHQVTEEFHAAFVHINTVRTDLGSRLNTLDIQESQHEDFKLSMAKSKSNFEDLDYAQAVIEFNENSLALKASQQAFGKVKDLTLFNYI
ncbi:Flagellar Hook associated protein [Vibrio nigripulchritudo MADA3029]|uniref:Flagellar Hook associated protein n=2 Tax=Vibrio nigripulchritudo TaxID=28173 RepID=U4K0C1_9VIBR|nr:MULTISPECIES: flagellar hook-associated protein FlgL [Vibrio]EGU59983.1 flagellar hook-associated protein FlgL [Vibrio nigripulchritudo ATCC 27043]KJY69143.1 flagellar hook protein FlgL [Vibrio nigripulchritudo]UAB69577.1 flagellar hook-associated protein FlgL [Vibrio sp. SCSIO 43132]CCN37827.1 Flagellar Hook associated protein [Vibrio nigripulchritudo AM115]CCN39861.1 Flagellar Hook associated protein [Vibrio nigripulchritudo FTn2]